MNPRDENREMDQSLGLFEAALSARPVTLDEVPRGPVLVALDGSDQDGTVQSASAALAARLGARRDEFRPNVASDPRQTSEQILERARSIGAAILVADTPFGEDLGSLRTDSLGAVIDILLAESSLPILLVRHPIADPTALIRRPVVLLDWRTPLQNLAGAWAARLATPGGEIDLLAAPEPAALSEIRALLGEEAHLLDELLERAESRISGSVLAALRHLADIGEFAVRLQVASGPAPSDLALACAGDGRPIVVAYRSAELASTLARVRNLALEARTPILALPVLP